MKSKSFFLTVYITLLVVLVTIGSITYVIDPYFHYRAPWGNLSYSVASSDYCNDGISRNFDYDAMIAGTSMTHGFKVAEANELFQKSFIRITYLGEGFYRIGKNIRRAIVANEKLDTIFWDVDHIWYVCDSKWEGRESYPEYLLNDDPWDDVNYLLNGQVFVRDTVPEIVRTVKGIPPEDFDSCARTGYGNKEGVLENYHRSEKQNLTVSEEETEIMMDTLRENLDVNIESIVKENPDITFYLFIPPLSILWWDDLNQSGKEVLLRRIDFEQAVIETFIAYDNVKFFSFEDEVDIVCDLDNYKDTVHYSEQINSYMLRAMKEEKHLLTQENYLDYLEGIRDFYSNYDYDSLFAE